MTASRKVAMLALAMMSMAAGAAELKHHKVHHSKTHISMIQAGSMANGGRFSGGVRRGFLGERADDDDNADDDDDDDDDDDEQKDAAEEKLEVAKEEADAKARAAQAKAKAEKKKAADAKALATAVESQNVAQSNLQDFNDDAAFDKKVNTEIAVIANETQSPGLSNFLGALRTEMRAYSKPSYSVYLESKVAAAEGKVAKLEAELNKRKKTEADASKVAEADATKKGKDVQSRKEAEKAEAKSDVGEAAAAISQKAGETWAISFFANVVLMAVVFAMASAANTGIKQGTWFLIDQVVAIFLAVMYFQAFDSSLDYLAFPPQYHVLTSLVHALAMLAMVLSVAWFLRNDGIALAVLCGAGAHIVSFSSIHAAASIQNMVWLDWSYSWSMCVFGMLVLGLGLAIIGYLVYTAKKKAGGTQLDDFMDKTDDLENDFGAMAFSVVFTMFIRFLLTGHHPVDDDTEFDHTSQDRSRMFIYACVCLVIAAFVVSYCSKKADESDKYAVKRVMNFLTTVAAMNVAWAFLYWGEWEFFGALYAGEAIKGRVMFAIVTTCLGCLAMVGLSKIPRTANKGDNIASTMKVVLTAIGLLIAWSWELCFDCAMEQMVAGAAHPAGVKVASTIALFTVVVPVYRYYIKPACIAIADSPGA